MYDINKSGELWMLPEIALDVAHKLSIHVSRFPALGTGGPQILFSRKERRNEKA